MKLLLLDRDGTITENRARPGDYINHPDEIGLIDGVLPLLKYYRANWTIVLISNQGGIPKGFISLEDCVKGFQRTLELAQGTIDTAIFCPHAHPGDGDSVVYVESPTSWFQIHNSDLDEPRKFRKPNPGMLLQAIEDCPVAPQKILFVGDRPEDEQAATAAGIPFQWAEEWRAQPPF